MSWEYSENILVQGAAGDPLKCNYRADLEKNSWTKKWRNAV